MGTKKHGTEIKFSDIDPLELSGKLGLTQISVSNVPTDVTFTPSQMFGEDLISDEESIEAFEAFKSDYASMINSFEGENSVSEISISSDKISLFLWSLLKEIGKRSNKKLSSVTYIFKDKMMETLKKKCKRLNVLFEDADFDTIVSFLQEKHLIRTSGEGIRITRKFAQLFHECYGAWLSF